MHLDFYKLSGEKKIKMFGNPHETRNDSFTWCWAWGSHSRWWNAAFPHCWWVGQETSRNQNTEIHATTKYSARLVEAKNCVMP